MTKGLLSNSVFCFTVIQLIPRRHQARQDVETAAPPSLYKWMNKLDHHSSSLTGVQPKAYSLLRQCNSTIP